MSLHAVENTACAIVRWRNANVFVSITRLFTSVPEADLENKRFRMKRHDTRNVAR